MSLSQDLMGLGISPLQAAHTASGGTGPLTGSAIGSSATTATKVGAYQYVLALTTSGASTTSGVTLPTVGGDTGCLLADDFVINNQGTTTITVYASSGVSISMQGINSSAQVMSLHTSFTLYPISTTQWFGVKGS
jgi:hypothetical protein